MCLRNYRIFWVFWALLIASFPAIADEFDFAIVPTATFGSDEGFGTGGVASFYFRDNKRAPYHVAVTANVFVTSRLIQRHRLRLDWIDAFDLPLRIYAQAGYDSTITQNFCGYGNRVTCDTRLARQRSEQLSADLREDAFRRYYLLRFIRPYGEVLFRYALSERPQKWELFAGWRTHFALPGELTLDKGFIAGPFANTLYSERFAEGERGLSSVLQAGLAYDGRDVETRPSKGIFFEGSVRASHAFIGSAWNNVGTNLTAAIYKTLLEDDKMPRLILAHRIIVDASFGDVNTHDMARVGGLTNFINFGGSDIGRGIREHRFLGKLKGIMQSELRARFVSFDWLAQNFVVGAAAFYDGTALRFDLQNLNNEDEDFRLLHGFGTGLRILWNRDFALRLDVGFSPHEQYEPRVYIRVGDTF